MKKTRTGSVSKGRTIRERRLLPARALCLSLVAGLSWLAQGRANADEPAAMPAPPATSSESPPPESAPPVPEATPEQIASGSPVEPSAVAHTAAAPVAAAAPAAPPPPPYSLPWQLRPLTVANVIRSDTSVAFYKDAMGNAGSTEATMLLASYKLTPEIAPIVRLGWVKNDAPAMAKDGTSFVNPIVGIAYSHKLDSFRLAGFLATTIPIGQGAGQMPDMAAAGANTAGINARAAMDNAMFAVNYMTAIAGVGFGYIAKGLTVQAEATVFQLFRVRGNDLTASAPDDARTNSTAGLHVGYFVIPQLSLGGEIRYQRWLSSPNRLAAMGVKTPFVDASLDNVTFGVGPRGHFKVGQGMWLRPGISYTQGLDKPLSDSKYHVVQVDIPFIF
jgi:hypothetical protein